MADLICLSCQHFIPREQVPSKELAPRWKGICGHKDLEEANLIATVHNCHRHLRIVYPTRFEKVLEDPS
jgi:hypothetical protein